MTDVPDARSDHRRYDYIKYTFVDPERYKDKVGYLKGSPERILSPYL